MSIRPILLVFVMQVSLKRHGFGRQVTDVSLLPNVAQFVEEKLEDIFIFLLGLRIYGTNL